MFFEINVRKYKDSNGDYVVARVEESDIYYWGTFKTKEDAERAIDGLGGNAIMLVKRGGDK